MMIDLEEEHARFFLELSRVAEKKPVIIDTLMQWFLKPPATGTLQLRWRDGKLHSIEESRVTH